MNLGDLHPIVPCGEFGFRLWLLSRNIYPKQLLNLIDDNFSLLQSTLLRASKLPGAQKPILVCNTDHRFLVA
jgi:mannose-1-phosphate guanylyltransferase/mannose-6-phosphate isomerase